MKRKVRHYDGGSEDAVGYEESPPAFQASKKKPSDMTDEERYGKVGAEIRRLDPEAFKNRTDKSAEANMALLKKLRARKADDSDTDTDTDSGKGGGPQSGRVYMTDAMRQREKNRRYWAENPEEGAKTGEITEALIGPKMKAAAGAAAAGAAGYGAKKLRDYLMSKAASARGAMTDVARGDLAMARPVAAREAEAAAYAERIKNARRSPGMSGYKKGGSVKRYSSGGTISSASKRADGIAQRGKTRGKIC